MFTCVLRLYVVSKALVLKRFANFMEGADSVRLIGAISVDSCAEIRIQYALLQRQNQQRQTLEERCRKARLGGV